MGRKRVVTKHETRISKAEQPSALDSRRGVRRRLGYPRGQPRPRIASPGSQSHPLITAALHNFRKLSDVEALAVAGLAGAGAGGRGAGGR